MIGLDDPPTPSWLERLADLSRTCLKRPQLGLGSLISSRRFAECRARPGGVELLLGLAELLGPKGEIVHAADVGTGSREPKTPSIQLAHDGG
jgi:hypothetical protein